MIKIAEECKTNPDKILSAPHTTPVKKIDEVTAARHPDLNFKG
jgi:glycine dehydrogenase subunit 2